MTTGDGRACLSDSRTACGAIPTAGADAHPWQKREPRPQLAWSRPDALTTAAARLFVSLPLSVG